MRILLLLSFCWIVAGIARAEDIEVGPVDAVPLSADEKQMLQDRSKALHEKADLMRRESEAIFAAEHEACWKKFLVSDCQRDAKKAKTARNLKASDVEKEAREIDRKLRKANFVEHQQTRAEQAPEHAANAAEQAEKNRKAQEEAMARVEKKRQEAEQRAKQKGAP